MLCLARARYFQELNTFSHPKVVKCSYPYLAVDKDWVGAAVEEGVGVVLAHPQLLQFAHQSHHVVDRQCQQVWPQVVSDLEKPRLHTRKKDTAFSR